MIMIKGVCQRGRIDRDDIRLVFCTDFAPRDSLVWPYDQIGKIVAKAMSTIVDLETFQMHTEEDAAKQTKLLLLSMQGLWTQQHSYSWQCVNSEYVEDAPGLVHMWRANDDGSRRLMCRKETLSNRTMFLIGRAALDFEQIQHETSKDSKMDAKGS